MKVMQFSGGIDSLACLWSLKPIWSDLIVMWADTGAAYAETRELVERLQRELPLKSVVTAFGDQPKFISEYGYPSDIVPVDATLFGRRIRGSDGATFAPSFMCCEESMWKPADAMLKAIGATEVYRGQRDLDKRKSPIKSGESDDGIRYLFPLEGWTREQVFAYANEQCKDFIPEYYSQGEVSSRDCWNCTAYLDDNVQRIRNLPDDRRAVVVDRLKVLESFTRPSLALVSDICN